MTKQDLADLAGITPKQVNIIIDSIKHAIKSGEQVTLRGFGTFSAKTRAEKKARNICKGTEVIIPSHKIPFFKPSVDFKQELLKK